MDNNTPSVNILLDKPLSAENLLKQIDGLLRKVGTGPDKILSISIKNITTTTSIHPRLTHKGSENSSN